VRVYGRGVYLMAHSMGRPEIQPEQYTPLSLTPSSTPHHGIPFMDWYAVRSSTPYFTHVLMRRQESIRLGRVTAPIKKSAEAATEAAEHASTPQDAATAVGNAGAVSLGSSLASVPASLPSFLLSIVDSPAYGYLTMRRPSSPASSTRTRRTIRARATLLSRPARRAHLAPTLAAQARARARRRRNIEPVMSDPRAATDAESGNDGLVSVQSARWSEFLATMEGADHLEVRGARGLELDLDLMIPTPSLPEWDCSRWLGTSAPPRTRRRRRRRITRWPRARARAREGRRE
jgi:triacylglycerol lipase